jgi:hypothetical protein
MNMIEFDPDLPPRAQLDLLASGPIKVRSVSDLSKLADLLEGSGNWVHTMEVFEKKEDRAPLRVDLSLLGLDGEDAVALTEKPAFMQRLLRRQIAVMQALTSNFEMEVWLGEKLE